MKVLFIVPDGIGIRNYLYSDVIAHLKNKAEIALWSVLQKEAFSEVTALHQIDIDFKKITLPVENVATRLLREAATYARLVYNSKKVDNKTILTNWSKNDKQFKLRVLYEAAEILGNWAAKKYTRILWLEKKAESYWSAALVEKYKNELLALQPTSIFITHQRVAGLMPICIAAQSLGIKLLTAVYSWDNLPKARLAVKADTYLVWSNWMLEEMQTYYPHIPKSQVAVCGTPQFDFYFHKNRRIDRAEFARTYGLDSGKKWICFSGNDKMSCPYDPDYLNDLTAAVRKIPVAERPEIIFRRSPADFSDRYNHILTENKDLIKPIDPIWHNKGDNWGAFFSKMADVDMLVNITSHCGLVVNVGSTMAHDFAIYDKPCLYVSYEQPHARGWSVKVCYNFQHFRSMRGLDAVGFVNDIDEWVPKIRLALTSPQLVGPDRKLWFEKIVRHPVESNSQLIAKEIL